MANICSFEMRVKGNHSNIKQFLNAMKQQGKHWIGRGAELEFVECDDIYHISGWCKWSLYSSLISTALDFKKNPDNWDISKEIKSGEIIPITLKEACEMFNVEIEAWSDEEGCQFAEHMHYGNGYADCDVFDYIVNWNEVTDETTVVKKPKGFYEFDFL